MRYDRGRLEANNRLRAGRMSYVYCMLCLIALRCVVMSRQARVWQKWTCLIRSTGAGAGEIFFRGSARFRINKSPRRAVEVFITPTIFQLPVLSSAGSHTDLDVTRKEPKEENKQSMRCKWCREIEDIMSVH